MSISRVTWVLAMFSVAIMARPLPTRAAPPDHDERLVTLDGQALHYRATAGLMPIEDAKGQTIARMFYVAYTVDNLAKPSQRPLTFAYNGGPGGSAALVHLGAFGPRIASTTDEKPTEPPFSLVDNPDSILDVTDLVFIDPVGAGFSRLTDAGKPEDFFGVKQDAAAFSQFIRRYLTTAHRWTSPKYLIGESYGTYRSVAVAKDLQQNGVALSGITLMSTILDNETLFPRLGNDEPYWLFLPTEVAVAALYHKTAFADSPALLEQARAFAAGPYLHFLAEGGGASPEERAQITQRLHELIALPTDLIDSMSQRISPDVFRANLLGNTTVIGAADARYRTAVPPGDPESSPRDPTADAVMPPFTAVVNAYLRDELGYQDNGDYVVLNGAVGDQWQWSPDARGVPGAAEVLESLRDVMVAEPALRIFSANGLYDMTSPFLATEYTLSYLGLPAGRGAAISFGYYPSGHMIYLNPAAHDQLRRDLVAFYRNDAANNGH